LRNGKIFIIIMLWQRTERKRHFNLKEFLMKKMLFLIAIGIVLAYGQTLTITEPQGGAVYQSGQKVMIKWNAGALEGTGIKIE
jgi:hypothetical protein